MKFLSEQLISERTLKKFSEKESHKRIGSAIGGCPG